MSGNAAVIGGQLSHELGIILKLAHSLSLSLSTNSLVDGSKKTSFEVEGHLGLDQLSKPF